MIGSDRQVFVILCRGTVTKGIDFGDQIGTLHLSGIVNDGELFCSEVDRRRNNPGQSGNPLFDGLGTVGAGHPADGKNAGLRGGSSRGAISHKRPRLFRYSLGNGRYNLETGFHDHAKELVTAWPRDCDSYSAELFRQGDIDI